MHDKYIQDINYFLMMYENNHPAPYYSISKSELLKYIDEYISNYKITNDYDFQYIFRCIIKKLNGSLDTHTGLRFNQRRYLPVILKVFDNKVYIVQTDDSHKNLLGLKIQKLNNIDINQIISEIEHCYSYNTEGWRKHGIERILCDIEGILMLPSIDSECNDIIFECLNENGDIINVLFNVNDEYENIQSTENYVYSIIDDNMALKYSLCSEQYDSQMADTIEKLNDILENNKINNFILDIRDNIGGNSSIINKLVDYLKTKRLKIVILTNGNVYSSGLNVIQKMNCLDPCLIGGQPGSTVNHFGALDCQFYLPNTNIKAVISTKYLGKNYVARNKEEFNLMDRSELHEYYIEPDILIDKTLADYLNDTDSIMEAALKYLKNIEDISFEKTK